MALPEFSTQTSVETRASAARVKLWTDKNKDGTPDPATLTAGFQYASAKLAEYLVPRYGETVFAAWTISTAPAQVLSLSDDLSMWFFASSLNSMNELIQAIYDEAIATLERIKNRETLLYGVIESAENDKTETEALENPFSTRVYYNE